MWQRFFVVTGTIFLAFVVLFFSIAQTAQVRYSFGGSVSKEQERNLGDVAIDYYFPYPGTILPDHPLWQLKALRDRAWLAITPKAERKAELNLLFANKRIVASKILFQKGSPELAYSVLTKAEKYLEASLVEEEEARGKNIDTISFLKSLNLAALKHRQVIKEIIQIAPEDARPEVVKVEDRVIMLYKLTKGLLFEKSIEVPPDPFNSL